MYACYPNDTLDRFSEPLEGNPVATKYLGRFVTSDLAISLYEYFTLSEFIDFNSLKNIHEIGAGYGRTAYVIKTLHPSIDYSIFDIEPTLSLSKKYLTSILGDSLNFNTPENMNNECDLFLAIDCLHEMTSNMVKHYFDYANNMAKSFYYSCWNSTEILEHNISWKQLDYPVNPGWKEILNRRHAIRENYFEVIYEC